MTGKILDDISIIFLSWKRHLQKGMRPHGLNMKQFYVLRRLEKQGPLHPSRLARELFCDRPTATVILRNLAARGWITLRRDPDDGKRRLAALTPAGREKLAGIPRELYDLPAMAFDPCGSLTEEERTRLAELLGKMRDHCREIRRDL